MIINMTGGGGGAGATLVVTGVVGSICTVSKDTKTYTKTFGTDAKATFKGLTTGTWTVTMTNGTQTAVKTIVINVDYALTIAYFSATINVTYPSGSTCTASDGSTTLTAPDTTGTWACVVPNTGDWTVSCTDGTDTASKTVTISAEGEAVNVALTYILILFDASLGGDQTAITGGWNTTASHIGFGGADATKVWAGATGYGGYRTTTKNAIDITPYSTLKAIGTMTCEGNGAYPSWGVDNGADQNGNGNISDVSREYTIDVSSVTGKHTIYLAGNGNFSGDRPWIGAVTFTYMALLL